MSYCHSCKKPFTCSVRLECTALHPDKSLATAMILQISSRSQSGETCLPGIDPVRGPNSRTSSAISLDLVLESQRASSQGDNPSSHRDSAVRSQKPAERQPGSTSCSARSASQDKEFIDGASCATVCPALPSLVRQGSSSASSSEELIGALHSPSTPRNLQSPSNPGHLPSPSHASTSRPAKSPLPAPPLHLKVPYI